MRRWELLSLCRCAVRRSRRSGRHGKEWHLGAHNLVALLLLLQLLLLPLCVNRMYSTPMPVRCQGRRYHWYGRALGRWLGVSCDDAPVPDAEADAEFASAEPSVDGVACAGSVYAALVLLANVN